MSASVINELKLPSGFKFQCIDTRAIGGTDGTVYKELNMIESLLVDSDADVRKKVKDLLTSVRLDFMQQTCQVSSSYTASQQFGNRINELKCEINDMTMRLNAKTEEALEHLEASKTKDAQLDKIRASHRSKLELHEKNHNDQVRELCQVKKVLIGELKQVKDNFKNLRGRMSKVKTDARTNKIKAQDVIAKHVAKIAELELICAGPSALETRCSEMEAHLNSLVSTHTLELDKKDSELVKLNKDHRLALDKECDRLRSVTAAKCIELTSVIEAKDMECVELKAVIEAKNKECIKLKKLNEAKSGNQNELLLTEQKTAFDEMHLRAVFSHEQTVKKMTKEHDKAVQAAVVKGKKKLALFRLANLGKLYLIDAKQTDWASDDLTTKWIPLMNRYNLTFRPFINVVTMWYNLLEFVLAYSPGIPVELVFLLLTTYKISVRTDHLSNHANPTHKILAASLNNAKTLDDVHTSLNAMHFNQTFSTLGTPSGYVIQQ
jgi:hypothetical protein